MSTTRRTLIARLRAAPMEQVTGSLIGIGLAMLMQPWSIDIFSYGFPVLLVGVIGYDIAGKLAKK